MADFRCVENREAFEGKKNTASILFYSCIYAQKVRFPKQRFKLGP